MALTFKQIGPADVETLVEISRETFIDTFGDSNTKADMDLFLATDYSKEQLLTELQNPETFYFLVYQEEQLAAYLKLNIGEAQTELRPAGQLELQRIYVRPAFKGQGIGQALLQKTKEVALAQQQSGIWLGVWEHNLPALRFYEKAGFTITGQHDFILGNDRQRDLIMELELA